MAVSVKEDLLDVDIKTRYKFEGNENTTIWIEMIASTLQENLKRSIKTITCFDKKINLTL